MWTYKYWLIDALFNLNLAALPAVFLLPYWATRTPFVLELQVYPPVWCLWCRSYFAKNKKLNNAFCAVSQCLIYRAARFNEWLKIASWGHKRSKSPPLEGFLTSLISTKCKANRHLTTDQPSLLYHSWGNYTFTWLNHFWRMWTGDSSVVNQVAHLNSNTPWIKIFLKSQAA